MRRIGRGALALLALAFFTIALQASALAQVPVSCTWEWGGQVEVSPAPCETPLQVQFETPVPVSIDTPLPVELPTPLPVEEVSPVAPGDSEGVVEAVDKGTLTAGFGLGLLVLFTGAGFVRAFGSRWA